MADLRGVAKTRAELHRNHASSRPLSHDYEYIGLAGEQAFASAFGLNVDLSPRPAGDKGVDFQVGPYSIDVKAAQKAYNLIVEEGKVVASIYVLTSHDVESNETKLLGWEWGRIVKLLPTKDFGYGVINHFRPARELRSMESLHDLLRPHL